jgi:hypothetical protein
MPDQAIPALSQVGRFIIGFVPVQVSNETREEIEAERRELGATDVTFQTAVTVEYIAEMAANSTQVTPVLTGTDVQTAVTALCAAGLLIETGDGVERTELGQAAFTAQPEQTPADPSVVILEPAKITINSEVHDA